MDLSSLSVESQALHDAVTACGHNQSELARRCGVSQQAVGLWLAQGFVPLRSVRAVADATGVPDWRLCPDHYRPLDASATSPALRDVVAPA